jgi:alpha-tubulin suppressor-like RCC1 family protein
MKKFWKKGSSLLLAAVSTATFSVSPSGFANAAYVNQRQVNITSPESAFSGGAGVQGTYALDSQIALDKGGNIWIWGFYNYCTIWNAGQGGANSPTAKYGASYTDNTANGVAPIARDCGGVGGLNNQPAIIKGLNGIVSVAGSAYAIMAVDSKGNLYGWGDNSQYGFPYPASASLKASGGPYDPQSGGGVYGIYKDGTLPPEALPNKVNQANPNETPDTWKPIDGPDSVQPPASGPRYYADGFNKSKVVSVSSNEYGFGWLKEDGTVWTVGYNNFGARGVGKQNGTGMGTAPNSRQWNSLNDLSGAPYNDNGGATLVPTKVSFPDGVKIKFLSNSYEGFHAIDTDNNVWYWGRVFTGNSGLTTEEIDANSSQTDNSKPCYKVSGPAGWDEAYCYSPVYVPSITKVAKENGVVKFAEGYQYGALLDEHKKLWIWGSGDYRSGMPNATGNIVRQWTPIPSVFTGKTTRDDTITGDNVVDVNGVMHGGSFVTGDGYVYAWGDAYWGGAFSRELSPTAPARPVNYGSNNNYPGVVWDPTLDPQHRKAVKVGGNKDAGNFNLEDGSIYSWGENGAGVALGGRGYGLTVCAEGLPNCVSPKVDTGGNRVQGGNDVWPATFVPGIQNVGRYQTVVKNAYPFQGTPVKNGQVMEYTVKFINDRTSYQNPAVRMEDVWGGSASLVPGSFRAKYTVFQSHAVDADVDPQWDVTSKFNLTNTGYSSTDATMQILPQSTLVITYKVTVSGTSGSVGGIAKISDAASGMEIDSDETANNIVS